MTDRDVLKRASEALREAGEPSQEDLRELRERVLGGQVLSLSRARQRKHVRWILPLAAALVAGTAMGATPGGWEGMLQAVERFLDVEILAPSHEQAPLAHPKKRATPAFKTHAAQPASPSPKAPSQAEAPAPVEPAPAQQPEAQADTQEALALRGTARRSEKRRAVVEAGEKAAVRTGANEVVPEAGDATTQAAKTSEARARSRDLSLYQTAHELHFRARRYEEALRAWELYLAEAPNPTFALEARYNRALCLLHLGHYEEARAALRPFAEGRVLGGYRRKEAGELMQALDKRR